MPFPPRHLSAIAMNRAKVRVLRDLDRARDAPPEVEFAIPAQSLQDIMSDRPGRGHASMGDGRRSAMEYGSDPLAEETRRMLREVVTLLEGDLRKGRTVEIAVFAEPAVLGEWRKLAVGAIQAATIHEAAVNHLHLAPTELRHTLREALELPEA